ncbi:MAG: molybdenum cofactor biosynthesis protein B, partial [Hadesarchaea archaeon CG08_land_8_20_14_0_20_51_8]
MSGIEHRKEAPRYLHVAVLVISDTRAQKMREGQDEDVSGKLIEKKFQAAGYTTTRLIVPDDAKQIRDAVKKFIADPNVDAVIATGGTGITARDVTIETLAPMFEKELQGF